MIFKILPKDLWILLFSVFHSKNCQRNLASTQSINYSIKNQRKKWLNFKQFYPTRNNSQIQQKINLENILKLKLIKRGSAIIKAQSSSPYKKLSRPLVFQKSLE